jgi:hypothetical protein
MSRRIVKSYYDDLNKNSDKNVVDKLWSVILNIYFTADEDFGVEVRAHPDPKKSKEANDVTIACVHHATNKIKALYLFEDNRVKYEGRGSVWTAAKNQLTGYMLTQREDSRQKNEVIYGVVTVGRYSRFYQLNPDQTELDYYPGTGHDDIFEFRKNEREILDILLAIKAVVSRRASNGGSRPTSSAGSRPPSSMGSRPPSSAGSRPVSRASTRPASRG